MRIAFVMGTRPEIIKIAPLIRCCEIKNLENLIIHTEQHYDKNMSKQFFNELKLRNPDFSLNIGSGTHGAQTGAALIKLEQVLIDTNPDIVLVQGDTNSALAGALAAVKLNIPVGHVEAGLRSYDFRMPEEYNRRLIDHISKYLFAPTKLNLKTLQKENVWGDCYITGNTVIDACIQHYNLAKQESKIKNSLKFKDYVLCTIHRSENIDNLPILHEIIQILVKFPDNIILPLHPHTKAQLEKNKLLQKLNCEHIQQIPPVGYFDFLWLLKNCEYVLSDSGGVQEEATAPIFNKFVFVLREKTDRIEAVDNGFAMIVNVNSKAVLEKINKYRNEVLNLPKKSSPFGDGNAAQKIIDIIMKKLKI